MRAAVTGLPEHLLVCRTRVWRRQGCDKMLLAGAEGLARNRGQDSGTASGRPPIPGILTTASSLSREVTTGWLHVPRISQGHLQADRELFKESQAVCQSWRRH